MPPGALVDDAPEGQGREADLGATALQSLNEGKHLPDIFVPRPSRVRREYPEPRRVASRHHPEDGAVGRPCGREHDLERAGQGSAAPPDPPEPSTQFCEVSGREYDIGIRRLRGGHPVCAAARELDPSAARRAAEGEAAVVGNQELTVDLRHGEPRGHGPRALDKRHGETRHLAWAGPKRLSSAAQFVPRSYAHECMRVSGRRQSTKPDGPIPPVPFCVAREPPGNLHMGRLGLEPRPLGLEAPNRDVELAVTCIGVCSELHSERSATMFVMACDGASGAHAFAR